MKQTAKTDLDRPHLMFVYGSLMFGLYNHQVISAYNGKYVGDAVSTDDTYFMNDGGFPRVFDVKSVDKASRSYTHFEPHLGKIGGELWRVNDAGLAACDRLEGHPRHYCREQRWFLDERGNTHLAWIYLIRGPGWSNFIAPVDGVLRWTDKYGAAR